VSPAGDDANSGAERAPFRTITRAIQVAPAGATIVIRAGTYREAVPAFTKPLTLQAYPHEQVWMKGSIVVPDWLMDGSAWRTDNWTYTFCQTCYPAGGIDPAYPSAGLPDMVFVDGEPLAQVTSRSAIGPNTFFVDYATRRLYVGTNPIGRTVEASIHSVALNLVAAARGSIVRGLGFTHYAPFANAEQAGMVFGNTDRLTFENNTFAWSAAKGLVVYAPGAVIRGNTFIYNGHVGLGAWRADGSLIEANRFAGNNQEHFVMSGSAAEASGAKVVKSRNLVIRDNIFEANFGTGLWLDGSDYNVIVVRNIMRDNVRNGVYCEESTRAVIASNVLTGNRVGVSVSNSATFA